MAPLVPNGARYNPDRAGRPPKWYTAALQAWSKEIEARGGTSALETPAAASTPGPGPASVPPAGQAALPTGIGPAPAFTGGVDLTDTSAIALVQIESVLRVPPPHANSGGPSQNLAGPDIAETGASEPPQNYQPSVAPSPHQQVVAPSSHGLPPLRDDLMKGFTSPNRLLTIIDLEEREHRVKGFLSLNSDKSYILSSVVDRIGSPIELRFGVPLIVVVVLPDWTSEWGRWLELIVVDKLPRSPEESPTQGAEVSIGLLEDPLLASMKPLSGRADGVPSVASALVVPGAHGRPGLPQGLGTPLAVDLVGMTSTLGAHPALPAQPAYSVYIPPPAASMPSGTYASGSSSGFGHFGGGGGGGGMSLNTPAYSFAGGSDAFMGHEYPDADAYVNPQDLINRF